MKFPKQERLKHKKLIAELFAEGSASFVYPFRFICHPEASSQAPQVLINVSKRHFKRAVDRNRLKRQIREIYRLNKEILLNHEHQTYPFSRLAILYVAKEKLPFALMSKKMCRAFEEFKR